MRLTLEQLRVFVKVAEHQNMTGAAKALDHAQSAVSSAIATLEKRNATKLFHRIGRGIQLSEAGKAFLAEAKAVLARAEAAEQFLADFAELKRGALHVQASHTIAGYWLPRHLSAFRRAHPEIDFKLSIGNTAQVGYAVHEGLADLGFVEGMVDNPRLVSEIIAHDSLVLVVGAEHKWASRRRVEPSDLASSEWVLREAGSGTRSVFEAALLKAGLSLSDLTIAMELPSNDAVRAAVEAGMGATVTSVSVAAPSIEAGLLHQVELELPDRPFFVLKHRERYLSQAAKAFLALMEQTTTPRKQARIAKSQPKPRKHSKQI